MAESFKIEGLEETLRALEQLPALAQAYALKPAVEKAARLIANEAKSRVPTETGILKQAIGISKVKIYKDKGIVWGAAGPRRGFKKVASGQKETAWARGAVVGKNGKLRKVSKKKTTAGDYDILRNPVKYAHLVEKGRKAITTKKARALSVHIGGATFFRRSVAAAAPQPFMGPALLAVRSSVTEMMKSEISKGIEKQAMKFAKQIR